MKSVEQCNLIENKCVKKSNTVLEVADFLKDNQLRRVFVVDENNVPVGIVSSTDICNKIVAEGLDPKTLTAADIMSPGILIVHADDQLSSVAIEMDKAGVPSVAVIKDNVYIGELTVEECTKQCLHVLKAAQAEAKQ